MLKAEESHRRTAILDSFKEFIIANKNIKSQPFFLNFSVLDGNSSDFMDYDLPYPHYLHQNRLQGYAIAWAIAGFFGTSASKEFLLDVVARFILTFPTATRLPWTVEERETALIDDREPYELKEMARNLPSLPWGHSDTKLANFVDTGIRKINSRRNKDSLMQSEDALFEATRWHLYRRAYAERTTDNITEEYVQILLETENEFLTHKKSSGDIRSKAKRMAEYMQNEFVIYTDIEGYAEWSKEKKNAYMKNYRRRKGLVLATREEHMKKVNENKNAKAQAKIRGVLEDMFVQDTIKFKNGKLKIIEIAKLVDMTDKTVSKHLKEMGLI